MFILENRSQIGQSSLPIIMAFLPILEKKKYKVPILHLVVATSNFVNILYISITAITSLTLTL